MRWAVIALIVFGILAALFASILVSTIRSGWGGKEKSPSGEVVLAKVPLPSMSVVNSSHITKDIIAKDKLPKGYLSSPVQAIGRVLAGPVVEGQVLTEYCFVSEGTGAQLATALPYGMRAVSVMLASSAITGGLLYPGCVVDVLASFRLPSGGRGGDGQAISTTLLTNIQVLAVEGQSVVSKRDETKEAKQEAARSSSGRFTVTLMVDPKQAEALQLATNYGTISVAMRNPLDKNPPRTEATVLSEARLARFGSTLAPPVSVGAAVEQPDVNQAGGILTNAPVKDIKSIIATGEYNPRWEVTVIRGKETKEERLEVAEDYDNSQPDTQK